MEKLLKIQKDLKVPKGQTNKFGGYRYRSCEDIVEAAKPICHAEGLILLLSDKVEEIGGKNYVCATAALTDGKTRIEVTAYAREADQQKGMSESQLTGATSSYARKYALNGLFAIDDTADADATNDHGKATKANEDPNLSADDIPFR